MRVLLLTQLYPPVIGGEERHVRNLAQTLAARGHAVAVATQGTRADAPRGPSNGSVSEERFDRDGDVRVYRLGGTLRRLSVLFSDAERPFAPPLPDPELLLGLRRVVAAERPDIVHAHNWMLHSFLPLKRWSGVPFVVTLHDYSLVCARKNLMWRGEPCEGPRLARCMSCAAQQYGGIKGRLVAIANWMSAASERQLVDRFFAVSKAVANLNGLDQSGVPYEVVPNFVPDTAGNLGDGDPALLALLPHDYILYVGDLSPQKGIDLLLRAYALLPSPPPLVLIGRRLFEPKSELSAGILILEPWPHASVMHAWSRCLFGVAPSIWHEPCATVVFEAMAHGKPMVVTAMGGMPDLVVDGESGIVVPPEVGALAAAMARLANDSALRQMMAEAARTRVKLFMAATVVEELERNYRSLIAQTRRTPSRQLTGKRQP